MPWFNVDDKFWSHPKFLSVGFAARGLWVSAGSWCAQNLSDGWLPEQVLPMIAMGGDVADLVAELEKAALWIRGVGGWQFKDWTDWNKPREWHVEQRERHRRRQREYEQRKRQSTVDSDASGDASLTKANPTQPNPPVGTGSGYVQVAGGTDRSAIDNRERFDKFWRIAVRKTGKGATRKAFTKALTRTSEHHLAAAWTAANDAWRTWPDKTVVPHPATWLNQERWDDEPPASHATTSKTLSALDRANQMEIDDDPSGLPPTARASLTAGPTGNAG